MLNKKKFELSYRIHLKFNLSDTHISWTGYQIGSLTPKINIHLMAYKKKQTVRRCLTSKILLSQNQLDIFHTKMLQNTSRCHVTASLWILCNILENIPHALDVHAQRVLKYNFILINDFTIIETGGFNVFL
jgi:hypothetical protein